MTLSFSSVFLMATAFSLISNPCFAKNTSSSLPAKQEKYLLPLGKNPILIINSPTIHELKDQKKSKFPKKWRTTEVRSPKKSEKKTDSHFKTDGMDQLKLSGSAEFSKDQFLSIQKFLKEKGYSPADQVYIDLRQESHGFADGIALSWYQGSDTVNAGKTHEEALADEKMRLKEIQGKKDVVLFQFAAKEVPENAGKPELRKKDQFSLSKVKEVMTEEELVKSFGSEYLRITSSDHHRPTDQAVDEFVSFLKGNLSKRKWIHFHCAAGMGRTTLFMAMTDIIKNYQNKELTLDDILIRQAEIGGILLKDVKKKVGPERAAGRAGRALFIKDFYEYAKSEGPHGFTKPWSVWVKEHPEFNHPDSTQQ